MKLEKRENLNIQYVNTIQITTSQIYKIHDSDTELAAKNHSNIKYPQEKPKF